MYSKKELPNRELGSKLNSQSSLKDGLDNDCVCAKVKDFYIYVNFWFLALLHLISVIYYVLALVMLERLVLACEVVHGSYLGITTKGFLSHCSKRKHCHNHPFSKMCGFLLFNGPGIKAHSTLSDIF